MKIAHVSDIHIRNLRYHDEYRKAFADLYSQLRELKPDLIVNTGDTAHTKVQISPEFVQMASEFFTELGNIAPTLAILGNHDLNLKNADRLDAISPIVKNVRSRHDVTLPLKSGLVLDVPGFRFWLYGITDEHEHPTASVVLPTKKDGIDIGLFHGSVFGAVVDSGFELEQYEAKMERFDGMDFVMMGDIHKRQSFLGGRAWYAGSLIQQNFGEDPDKGFLVWDIRRRDDFDVTFHRVNGSRGFYTIQVSSDLTIPDLEIPEDARVRAQVDAEMTLSQQKDLEREIRRKFKPKDVVSITSRERPGGSSDGSTTFDPDESYVQRLIEFARDRGADDSTVDIITALDSVCTRKLTEDDVGHPHAFWRVNSVAWSNVFNYGSSNVIDMRQANGLVGVFAPNASGKSSLFDVLLQGLYDRITKDVSRNIDLINDNRDLATIMIDLSVGDESYVIERQIERIKYGQRKFSEAKEWGKTTLDLYHSTEEGKVAALETGVSRPETEREIRRLIGSFDDFVMTSMVSQNPIFGLAGGGDIINCKESDRKKILFKFLGLDSFEAKAELAKEELKKLSSEMKHLEQSEMDGELKTAQEALEDLEVKLRQRHSQAGIVGVCLDGWARDLREATSAKLPDVGEDPEVVRARIESIEDALITTQGKIDFDVANIQGLQEQLLGLEEPPGAPMSLEEIANQKTKLSHRKSKIDADVGRKLVVLNTAKKASETIDQVPCEGKYPTCKFLVDAFSARDALDEIREAYGQALVEQTGIVKEMSEITDLEVVSKQHTAWKIDVAAKRSEISSLQEKVAMATELRKAKQDDLKRAHEALATSLETEQQRKLVAEMKASIKNIQFQHDETKKTLDDLKADIVALERKIGSTESQIERLSSSIGRLSEIRRQVSAYELYIEAMGKHGIPYQIMAGMLPLINQEINKVLTQVVGFNVFIEHDASEQTLRLYIQYDAYKSRTLGLASGAEKFIAALAIRAALISVSRLPKTNVLIVDEGFGKLDSEMLDSVQRMLEYMKTIFGSVFIVSHVDALKDMVDSNIEISVDNEGYAHVEVV